jgi:GNAT superfamily N-acetyltransferase
VFLSFGFEDNKAMPVQPIVRIRRARQCDSAAIELLIRESFREYESAYTPEAFAITTPGKEEIEDRMKHWMVWVAVRASTIVGTVSAHAEGEALHIRSMAVRRTMRGKGIGRLLLARVENFACTNGYKRLILNTTPFLTRAIRLYKRFGFGFTGRERKWFGTRLSAMAKPLASAAP